MIKKEELLKIGRFSKPHGVKGELSLLVSFDPFDEEDIEDCYIVCEIDGILVPFFLDYYRYKSDTVILLKLEYVDNEENARKFSGLDVYFPLERIDKSIEINNWGWDHFIGYTVTDTSFGLIGQIKEVDESTINVLFRIDHNGKDILFPAAKELIVSFEESNKTMTVSFPDGLCDL